MSATLVAKITSASETVVWMIKLNAWWWLLTLLGFGVLGAGPATAAGAIAVRRHSRGEQVRFVEVLRCYRTEFVGANLVLTPPLIMIAMLFGNLAWATAAEHRLLQLGTVVALVALGVAWCLLGPLYAFYDLPRRRYLPQAIKITVARPQWSALLILVTATVVFACSQVIALIPIAAVGVWLHTCSWLGLRFFAENEHRRAEGESTDEPVLPLPSEPLRTH